MRQRATDGRIEMKNGAYLLAKVSEKKEVYLLLLMVVVLWGVNTVSIKYLTQFFPPLLLASTRLLLASVFLFAVFVCTSKDRLLPRSAWGATAGVSVFCIFLHQIGLTIGLGETSGTHATLILGLGPLFTTTMASVFLREPFLPAKKIGIFLGLCGIGLIVAGKSQSGASLEGDGITCLAAITFSMGSLFVKKAVLHSSSLAVTAYSHLMAAVGLTVLNLTLHPISDYQAVPWTGTVLSVLLFSSFMSTAVGALLWNTSIHKVGASTASLFQNASPIVGIFAAVLFLGEEMMIQYFFSLLLVIGGVVLGTGIWSMPKGNALKRRNG